MRHLIPVLTATALLLSAAAAYADVGDQLAKILPDDGAVTDGFGKSVASSGTTAIVGASTNDDNGSGSGSAYLFDISDPTDPVQIAKLLAEDAAEFDQLGVSVAISGAIAIVGAHGNTDSGIQSGSAYLFDTANGRQIAKLLPDDGAAWDQFGLFVAISGTTAIVGAPTSTSKSSVLGSAYLFDIGDPTNPVQIAKLLAFDGELGDSFGRSVAISGTRAIVGAARDGYNGFHSGSAYLFDIGDPKNIVLITKLHPDDAAEFNRFGISVAISGTTTIIGASGDDDNGLFSGSAYLFDTTEGSQIAKLLPDDGAFLDQFGLSVAISGTTASVGASGGDDNGSDSGSAYVFDFSDPRDPVQIAKLLAKDGAEADFFGNSVAISGAIAIVGAYGDDDNGGFSGSAYLFDASTCPADFNGDGNVEASDLAALLGNWGPCVGCPADFDDDGDVDAADLALLLGSWGPCF